MEVLENKRIIELPKHVADKIAAGEVVDRPLSIVKELVENSIDAGSTSIIVEIRNGGKSYIRVTDNGSGIEKGDIDLAFKRHATSKIKSASDLDHINSLGFRGEALASISAVSRVELITKTVNEKSGIRIKIEGGEVLEKEDTGCPEGTTIIIEDLFFNTPARLKFMKPDATESTLIIDFISKMTLAYPEIKIRLINNSNILFSTAGKGDIYSNILTIYSKEIGDKLIRLEEENDQMSLVAFVSAPSNSKTNRKSQIFFVNGRYISSKLMENAVTEAYLEKLFEGRYPIAFLFLQVAPEKLDVNIHPNKKEVRFDDERLVKDFISTAIRKSLQTKEAIPEIKENNLFKLNPSVKTEEQVDIKKLLFERRKQEENAKEKTDFEISIDKGQTEHTTGDTKVDDISEVKEQPAKYIPDQNEQTGQKIPDQKPAKRIDLSENMNSNVKRDFDIRELSVTGSIFGTYITAIDENNLYLIDQHAAHERVFYEQLLEQYQNEEKTQQLILTPYIVNVTHAVKNDTGGMFDFLGNLGFQIEEFGPTAYIIKAIPSFMEFDESKDFMEYLLDNISEEADLENQKKISAIITNACKKSVKAHDVLDKKEIDQLITDLAKTKNPYSCPHGRPTFIKLNKYEIEKMFKRV
ncbi:MAG: DNA mismatch repair endonuclease MutL [Bacillota bacterium]